MIEQLIRSPDDAARWLDGIRGADGVADLSSLQWESSLVVIQRVSLEKVRVCDVDILPDIVTSQITESEFNHISSDAHFWGADNRWNNCTVNACELKNMISPKNLFEGCRFENCSITGYRPYMTLFRRCKFVNCAFRNVTAVPVRRRDWPTAEMATVGSSLQFTDCTFEGSTFRHCRFRDVAFRRCIFANVCVDSCSLEGVNSDVEWWGEVEETDLFLAFLDEAIRQISEQLGSNSVAVCALRRYRNEYAGGATTSKDYSACLYSGDVPDSELDRIEELLDELELQYHL